MNTLTTRNKQPVLLTVLALFAIVLWGAPAHSTTVTPSDAVTTRVVVRAQPSVQSADLGTLAPGDQAEELESVPRWLKVQLVDGTIGYVSKRWVIEVQAPSPSPSPSASPTTACDSSIAAHVYNPARLIVKQDCISVTGVIVDATATQSKKEPDGVRHEADGDTHGWLKVDPGFENLLNAGNMSDEGGNLVFEIICKYPVTQTDAKAACQGYTDHVTLPPVGSHVRIVGRFVQDTLHGQWNEIHPVTSINVVP